MMATRAIGWVVCASLLLAGCSSEGIDVIQVDPMSLGNNLLAHWRFDDGAGNVLTDHSGSGRDGTISNGTWVSGPSRFGGALRFSGTGEVSVPSFPQPTGNWSVAGWVRPPPGDFGDTYLTLISTELVFMGGWQLNVRLTVPTAAIPVGVFYQFAYWIGPMETDYLYVDCACVDVGQWDHLAAVVDRDAGKLTLYKNGVLVGEKVATPGTALPAINTGSATLYLARWPPGGRELTGDIDDFVVYNRALSPHEVELIARSGLPAAY